MFQATHLIEHSILVPIHQIPCEVQQQIFNPDFLCSVVDRAVSQHVSLDLRQVDLVLVFAQNLPKAFLKRVFAVFVPFLNGIQHASRFEFLLIFHSNSKALMSACTSLSIRCIRGFCSLLFLEVFEVYVDGLLSVGVESVLVLLFFVLEILVLVI